MTNGSLLPWTGAKLPDLLPEAEPFLAVVGFDFRMHVHNYQVHFSGKVLPPEAMLHFSAAHVEAVSKLFDTRQLVAVRTSSPSY